MKIYDISQEIFNCMVYPGDPAPERTIVCQMEQGDLYNLSAFSMGAHNGTHVDAPYHFYRDGKRVDQISLNSVVGYCYVYTKDGELGAKEAETVIEKARTVNPECARRLLFRGQTTITEEASEIFAQNKLLLIGNESQTVGPENAPMRVHLILLKEEIVLLEGVRLSEVPDGAYLLNAAPINLGGADGAPCRALLISL